jgi:hypothetical protein
MTDCKWCGAPTETGALPSDATADVCAGRYACRERKAMEEGQEDRDATIAALKAELTEVERERGELRVRLTEEGRNVLRASLAFEKRAHA